MNRRTFIKTLPAFAVLTGTALGQTQNLQPIKLVEPQTVGRPAED